MENLHRVIAAYEKMDKRARDEYVILMEHSAQKHPMQVPQTVRKLSLVPTNKRG